MLTKKRNSEERPLKMGGYQTHTELANVKAYQIFWQALQY